MPARRRRSGRMRYSVGSTRLPYNPSAAPASPLDTATSHSFRHDARVIALVAAAHSLSHFLQLALPPLFPLLRAEFDVSWTLLGALVGTFYVASGLCSSARALLSTAPARGRYC